MFPSIFQDTLDLMSETFAWLFDAFGGPLRWSQDPEFGNSGPVPKKGHALVRIRAVALNPVDYKILDGEQQSLMSKKWPKYLGSEFSGEVLESGTTSLAPGTRVYGMVNPLATGCLRQTMLLPEFLLVPHSGDHSQMAALPVAFTTIWQSIDSGSRNVLAAGHAAAAELPGSPNAQRSVFVLGANGGIGSLFLQVAAVLGWRIGASAAPQHRPALQAAVQAARAGAEIGTWTDRGCLPAEAFNLYFDTPGIISEKQILESLPVNQARPRGGITRIPVQIPNFRILAEFAKSLKPLPRVKTRLVLAMPNRRALETAVRLLSGGQIRPLIAKIFPRDRVNEAYDLLRAGGITGKLVVTFD